MTDLMSEEAQREIRGWLEARGLKVLSYDVVNGTEMGGAEVTQTLRIRVVLPPLPEVRQVELSIEPPAPALRLPGCGCSACLGEHECDCDWCAREHKRATDYLAEMKEAGL